MGNKRNIIIIVLAFLLGVGGGSAFVKLTKNNVRGNTPVQNTPTTLDHSDTSETTDESGATDSIDILKIRASSELANDGYGNYYYAENVLDGLTSTAWTEGVSGNGEGETLTYTLAALTNIHSCTLYNGYCKSEDLYYKNSRPSKITFIFDDGEETVLMQDRYNVEQVAHFKTTHQTTSIVLRIDETFDGSKYTDTCISEIYFN